MEKKLIWLGLFVGATAGNCVPMLWGGSAMSLTGMLLAFVGAIAGIWLGHRAGQSVL